MSYEHLAQQYDAFMYDVPSEEWFCYISQFFGAPCRVLEYACGTGRITAHLVRSNYETIAIDQSEEMLNGAITRLRPLGGQLQLLQADMRTFRLTRPAELALCVCDGVNYLRTENDLTEFFRNVRANLCQNGRFVFDVSSAYKLAHVLGNELFYDDGEDATLFWQNKFDPNTQLCEMNITLFQRQGTGYERFDEVHVQRAWTTAEITAALVTAGFREIHSYAFGTTEAPRDDTNRIQFVAAPIREYNTTEGEIEYE